MYQGSTNGAVANIVRTVAVAVGVEDARTRMLADATRAMTTQSTVIKTARRDAIVSCPNARSITPAANARLTREPPARTGRKCPEPAGGAVCEEHESE